jgi:hypothetical protein
MNRLRMAVTALVLASVVITLGGPVWAAHMPTHKVRLENYDEFVRLRFKEKWLLPPVALPTDSTGDILDLQRGLRPFTGGKVAGAVNSVDLQFQAAPFGTDVLINRDQARALTQLGMLATAGHFAIINSGNPQIKQSALDILNQLADISDHFKLGALRSQYQRLITEVGDARFQGGPGPSVDKYAATVASLYDYVANTYGIDGHWYFMFGNTMTGLYALSTSHDQLHSEYYLTVLNDLYHRRPSLRPDYLPMTGARWLHWETTVDSDFINATTWSAIQYYMLGETRWVNPYTHQQHMD